MSRKNQVLIVDDDQAVRLRVRDLLASIDGCEVIEADCGRAGLAAARTHAPALVLLDLMMPGMSGLEVCVELRADPQTREIPIIVLSAVDEHFAMPAALAAGAEDYLSKPIPSGELRAKVGTIMQLNRHRSLIEERRRLRWVIEHSQEALVSLDSAGRLIEGNRRARELFDLPAVPGADVPSLVARHYHPEPPDALAALRSSRFCAGAPFALFRPATPQLPARWLEVGICSIEDDPAAPRLLKFTDRTEQTRLELESWTFHRLVSHKLRTPLNGLEPTLDLMADAPAIQANPELSGLLQLARESLRRLDTTLLAILRYQDALHNPLPCGPARAAAFPSELLQTAAAEAGLAPGLLRIKAEATPRIPATLAGPVGLVLVELIANGIKFGDASRTGVDATVSIRDDGLRVRLDIAGPQLAPELVAGLGRPYWQPEASFAGEVPGMGLGLATARLFLRVFGARLDFVPLPSPGGLGADLHLLVLNLPTS